VAQVGIKELLEAGVHFGHQTRRWNPKMRRFIHGERSGIYIIDLLKTERLIEQAQQFTSEIAHRGGSVLFVGTKKQARDGVKEVAEKAGMPYVNHRWLGGLLTNFQTINLRIKRLHELEGYAEQGQLALLPTRERMAAEADLIKLQANLGGVKHMQRVPDAVFIIDLKVEALAVREAQRLRIPIIGLVDTNCDPDGVTYVIPGNDDAIRSCALITHAIGDVAADGRAVFRAEEERARREAEEQARRQAEEQARREAEERARQEAEEAAAKAAADQAAQEAAAQEAATRAPAPAAAPQEPAAPAPAPAAAPQEPAAPAPAPAAAPQEPAAPAPAPAAAPQSQAQDPAPDVAPEETLVRGPLTERDEASGGGGQEAEAEVAQAAQQVDRMETEGGVPEVPADPTDTPGRDPDAPKPDPQAQTSPQAADEE